MFGRSRQPEEMLAKLAALSQKSSQALAETLRAIADVLLDGLPNVEGAAIVAFERDEELPRPLLVAAGRSLLSLDPDDPNLATLPAALQSGDGRCGLTLGGEEIQALAIHPGSNLLAAALFASPDSGSREAAEELFRDISPWVGSIIRQTLAEESARRTKELHELASRELSRSKPDLKKLIHELAEVFPADVVTILFSEEASRTLRLSCSTDPRLGVDRDVVYREYEGLTGFVFAEGRPLRLSSADDPELVRRAVGRELGHPRHRERGAKGEKMAQFLGAPIRASGRTFGVIRLSRAKHASRFTADEESALEFFAQLLGIALQRTWNRIVAQAVEESSTIGIAISYREPAEDGKSVPKLSYVNPGACEILGYRQDEVQGKDARELYALNDYQALHAKMIAALEAKSASDRVEIGPEELHLLHRDGSPRAVRITFRLVEAQRIQPPAYYTIGIFRDRTEEAKIQAQHNRLTEMLAKMGIAYFRSTPEGRSVESSTAEAEILGFDRDELGALDRFQLFEDPDQRKGLMQRTLAAEPGALIHVRQPLLRKDGTKIDTEGYMRTVKEKLESGQLTVEGLYQDVTQRLNLQRFVDIKADEVVEEDVLLRRLMEREQRQRDYLSSLGHQLSTPFGSLVGNLEDLKSGLLEERGEIDQTLTWVIGQTRQCMRMVQNLSYLDKILRQETLVTRPLSPAKLCIETKIDFQHVMDEKKIGIYIDDASIRRHLESVNGHIDLLRQVIINLVDNALKYSRPYTTVRIGAVSGEAGAALEISNEGLPVPAALREKIFERSFRTNRARMLVPDGTGLGLWLVRLIVEAHGATVVCDEVQQPRRRTVFRLTFPSASPNPGDEAHGDEAHV